MRLRQIAQCSGCTQRQHGFYTSTKLQRVHRGDERFTRSRFGLVQAKQALGAPAWCCGHRLDAPTSSTGLLGESAEASDRCSSGSSRWTAPSRDGRGRTYRFITWGGTVDLCRPRDHGCRAGTGSARAKCTGLRRATRARSGEDRPEGEVTRPGRRHRRGWQAGLHARVRCHEAGLLCLYSSTLTTASRTAGASSTAPPTI